jgi:drug/metabolite transporter (DMT)-like permease
MRIGHAQQPLAKAPAPRDVQRMTARDAQIVLSRIPLRTFAMLGMCLCMLIYGSNFVISRHAVLNGLTPHDMLALRFTVAGLLLLPVFGLFSGWKDCAGLGWGRGVVLAIMSGLPMSYLMMMGLSMAPAAHGASIGPGTVTVIGVVGAVLWFGAKLTPQLVAGVAIVLAGLAALAFAGTKSDLPYVLWGDLCFLGVGLVWGGYPLLIQKWKVDGLKATAVVSVLSMVYLPYYLAVHANGFDSVSWWIVAAHAFNQGVLNVFVGLWIWGWAARVLGASIVGRFPPSIPVIGTLLGIPILGEWPGPLQWVGVAMIVGGLLLAAYRKPETAAG